MVSVAKKLKIIEEVLKINDSATLIALEKFMRKAKKAESTADISGFKEFSGIWSEGEAEEIERIIAESCENIHPDDWK